MYDNEQIYDEQICPLMEQIIEICKRENLPMVSQFYLKEEVGDTKEPMYCTTVLIPKKSTMNTVAYEQLAKVNEIMKYGPEGKPIVTTMIVRSE